MEIKKILNNNAVIAIDSSLEEVVIMGLGLAFNKKKGDVLEQEKIERIFKLDNSDFSNKLVQLVKEIPIEYIDLTEKIVELTKEQLNTTLNPNIYITLSDHISFAVSRYKDGIDIRNPLSWEIQRFYQREYKVGKEALKMIHEELGIRLPDDEAASIAMHVVNAEMNEEMPNVVNMVKILQDSLNIIKYHFLIEFDQETLDYQRLVTHLKFFAQRIINGEVNRDNDDSLLDVILKKYPDSFECAMKIKLYLEKKFNFQLHESEITYLTVHIERVINNSNK